MVRILLTCFALLGFGLSTALIADQGCPERPLWIGQSGGFIVQWCKDDITAHPVGNPTRLLFSAKSIARNSFEYESAMVAEAYGQENRLSEYERDFTVMSMVGSIITFKDHYYTSLKREAHPAGETRYTAIDLAKQGEVDPASPGEVVKLTDFFMESDILHALLADPLIGEALKNADEQDISRRDLSALIEELSGPAVSEKYCYEISDDLLTRFAFHHIEKGKVAVRIGLSGAGPCRESLTEIGILLPIPERLKRAFALAESGKEGFLMKDLKKIARGQKFILRFKANKGSKTSQ